MTLDENEVNEVLKPLCGQYEDSFQEAWVEVLERNPQTVIEIFPIARRVRNRAIKNYLEKKYKEESLYRPLGNNHDGSFTLESIPPSLSNEDGGEKNEEYNALYKKIVDFLIGEYSKQKAENIALKRKEIELKAERLKLRKKSLRFKKKRLETWKKLIEERGKRKEIQTRLKIELQREKLAFEREELLARKGCTF
jgi:hypothetical protein